MKKLQRLLASAVFTTALFAVFTTNTAFAQEGVQQPAQAAQIGETETLPQSNPATVTTAPVTRQKETKKVPQIVVPANATAKEAKKIAKANEMLEKATEQQASGEVKELNKVQKAAAQMALKKLTKKLDKMGVQETKEIKELKDASAAKAMNNMVLIGLVLLLLGLVLLFVPSISILGLLLFIVGLVLLLVGLIQS
jgi:hypothetical protein